MCVEMNFNIYKGIRVKFDNKRWCDYMPNLVETGHEGKLNILWNQQVQTDRTVPNNKLDIKTVLINKEHAC